MKVGEFIDEQSLINDDWTKLVKYGSIAHIYTRRDEAVIVNSLDGQIVRYISKEELEAILEQWKIVLSVNGHTK